MFKRLSSCRAAPILPAIYLFLTLPVWCASTQALAQGANNGAYGYDAPGDAVVGDYPEEEESTTGPGAYHPPMTGTGPGAYYPPTTGTGPGAYYPPTTGTGPGLNQKPYYSGPTTGADPDTAYDSNAYDPDASNKDLADSPTASSVRGTDMDALALACKQQQMSQRPQADIATCKKKCATGMKQFCSCAFDPCAKFNRRMNSGNGTAADARGAEDEPLPSETPQQCNLEGKLGQSGYGAVEYRISWDTAKKLCREGASRRDMYGRQDVFEMGFCQQLCKQGCGEYCDYCALGYKDFCKEKTPKPGVGLPNVDPGYRSMFSGIPQKNFKGCFAEVGFFNTRGLEDRFDAGMLGSKTAYDGIPTIAERDWLAVNQSCSTTKSWNNPSKQSGNDYRSGI